MLYIAGYSDIGSTTRGSIAIPLEPPISEQAIDVGPASVQSKPLHSGICIVKLLSDEDCMIDIGPNPDATSSARKLMAGKEQIVTVPVGGNFKIAVAASNSGSVTGMDSLESLLKLLASPAEVKKQLDVLAKAAAKTDAAAQAHKDAVKDSAWSGKLSEWEQNLNQREQDVAALKADLEGRLAKLRALA